MLIALWMVLGLLVGTLIEWLAVTLPRPYLRPAQVSKLSVHSFIPLAGWRMPVPRWVPLVQIGAALAFGLLAWRIEVTAQMFQVHNSIALLLVTSFYAATLGLILLTDYLYRLILTVVTMPATLLALLLALVVPDLSWQRFVAGSLIYGLLFACLYLLARVLYRKRGIVPFGMGDVRLALFIGMALGLPAANVAIFSGVILAGVAGLGIVLITGSARGVMPYGVPLCITALAVLVVAPHLVLGF